MALKLADSKAHNTTQLFQAELQSKVTNPSLNSCLLLISFFRAQYSPSHCSECYSLPGLLELIIVGTEIIANEAALNLLAAFLFS